MHNKNIIKFTSVIVLSFLILSFKTNSQVYDEQFFRDYCINYDKAMTIGSTDAKTNGQVSQLQNFLYNMDFLSVKPTGYFGSLTWTAVANYQKSKGIDPVGSVGPITRFFLTRDCGMGRPVNNYHMIDLDLGCLEIPYNLRFGTRDTSIMNSVSKLQTYFFQNGLMSVGPTGEYDERTMNAVIKYQTLRRLNVSGLLDSPTRITIAKETCGGVTSLVLNPGERFPSTSTTTSTSTPQDF